MWLLMSFVKSSGKKCMIVALSINLNRKYAKKIIIGMINMRSFFFIFRKIKS